MELRIAICEECAEEITPADAQTSAGGDHFHTRCWNAAREAHAAYAAECEDSEGFTPRRPARRPPGRAGSSAAVEAA